MLSKILREDVIKDFVRKLRSRRQMAIGVLSDVKLVQIERAKYERIWAPGGYGRKPRGVKQASQFADMSGPFSGATVIDFGCGMGEASRFFLEHGSQVIAIDIAANSINEDLLDRVEFYCCPLWELPDHITGDFGFCSDVMEHIPPFKVDATLRAIRRASQGPVFFNIALGIDNNGRKIGELLHLTVKPLAWWRGMLAQHWRNVQTSWYEEAISACFIVKP